MGGIRQQTPKFASMFMIMVLASVALPGTFNFVGEFTVLYSLFTKDLAFAVLGGTTIILGAFYMLRMFQNVMLGETNAKPFADVNLTEGIVMVVIIGFLLFFGLFPKPIIELITPSIQEILVHIK
jgi:NADH-quinone oxidoreductase subunit M